MILGIFGCISLSEQWEILLKEHYRIRTIFSETISRLNRNKDARKYTRNLNILYFSFGFLVLWSIHSLYYSARIPLKADFDIDQAPHYNLTPMVTSSPATRESTLTSAANLTITPSATRRSNTTECIRFGYTIPTGGSGLGHRFSEVVMGMKFAEEVGATYLYDPSIWNSKAGHGSYNWMPDFLPIQETELTRLNPEFREQEKGLTKKSGQWRAMVNYSKEENPCYAEIYTRTNWCCPPGERGCCRRCWCTYDTAHIGAFDAMKGRMRKAFSKSKYSPSKQLPELLGVDNSKPFSSIVWHLRVGDIVLNNDKAIFSGLSTEIVSAFQNSRMDPLVVFLGEGGEKGISESFPFLQDICNEFFPANCFYPEIDVRDSFYYMIYADILVTSGSSFASAAAALRTRGITLFGGSKPDEQDGVYFTSEQLKIDMRNGTIQNINALKKYLQQ